MLVFSNAPPLVEQVLPALAARSSRALSVLAWCVWAGAGVCDLGSVRGTQMLVSGSPGTNITGDACQPRVAALWSGSPAPRRGLTRRDHMP